MREQKNNQKIWGLAFLLVSLSMGMLLVVDGRILMKANAGASKPKIFAQALVEKTAAKHAELAGLELATVPPDQHDCVTIAATDAKEIGDKCEKGELIVMETGKPTVEKEEDGFDVTLPLHVGGKTIGFIGRGFKPGQDEAGLLGQANPIAKELESQIPSKAKLFEAEK
jgi:hypothetical protein